MSAIPMALPTQMLTTAGSGSAAAAGKVPAGVFGLALQEALDVPGEGASGRGTFTPPEQGTGAGGEAGPFAANSEVLPGLDGSALLFGGNFAAAPSTAAAAGAPGAAATATVETGTWPTAPAEDGTAASAGQAQLPPSDAAAGMSAAAAGTAHGAPTLPAVLLVRGQGPEASMPPEQPVRPPAQAAGAAPLPLPATPAEANPVPAVTAAPAPGAAPAPTTGSLPEVTPATRIAEAVAAPAAQVPESLPAPVAPAVTGQTAPAAQVPAAAAQQQPVPAALPLNTQVARPVFSLAQAGPGEHTMTLKVSPEELGPVTVRAHIGTDNSVRVELFAANDAGREALKTVMAELRRDLAASGLNANLDLSAKNQPGDAGAGQSRREQEASASTATGSGSSQREAGPQAGGHRTFTNGSSLDVMA